MNIKKLVPIGILAVIIAGGIGAYMFLFPQEEKVSHTVVTPKTPPRVPAPAAQPPVAAPKAAVAPVQVIAPVSAPSAARSRIAAPVAPPPAATSVVAAPVQALQPPLKLSKTIKTANKPSQSGEITSKPKRPKNLDLRKCLNLETNAAIAKCAGE
jgi:hypothetical protein